MLASPIVELAVAISGLFSVKRNILGDRILPRLLRLNLPLLFFEGLGHGYLLATKIFSPDFDLTFRYVFLTAN